jgi:hypothetical protein
VDPHVLVLERAPLDQWRPTYGSAAAGTATGRLARIRVDRLLEAIVS